jgi:ABC-type glycerol-3-phosphate transport system permease component
MFFFGLITLALLFTGDVTGTPQYIIISSMRLINSYWALILPSLAFVFGLYLMRQNMLDFPEPILESARIDGASEWHVFWSIIMPNMKAVWLTLLVFSFNGNWGRGEGAFIYNESLKGLPTVLGQIASGGIARAGVGAAIGILMMLPPILNFVITQSNIMESMANSGMKD